MHGGENLEDTNEEDDVNPLMNESQSNDNQAVVAAELDKLIDSYKLITVIDTKRALANDSVSKDRVRLNASLIVCDNK